MVQKIIIVIIRNSNNPKQLQMLHEAFPTSILFQVDTN